MRKILFLGLVVVVALLLLTAATPAPASASGPAYYVVRHGDTLDAIAWRHGISSWSLARANGLWNPNLIYAGQLLVVPYGGYVYQPVYQPPPAYNPPRPYGCYYWVRYGDTMYSIARRYGGDPWTIARSNGIYNLNWIYAGQRLFIPGCN